MRSQLRVSTSRPCAPRLLFGPDAERLLARALANRAGDWFTNCGAARKDSLRSGGAAGSGAGWSSPAFLEDAADACAGAYSEAVFAGHLCPRQASTASPCGHSVPYCSDRFNPDLLTLKLKWRAGMSTRICAARARQIAPSERSGAEAKGMRFDQ